MIANIYFCVVNVEIFFLTTMFVFAKIKLMNLLRFTTNYMNLIKRLIYYYAAPWFDLVWFGTGTKPNDLVWEMPRNQTNKIGSVWFGTLKFQLRNKWLFSVYERIASKTFDFKLLRWNFHQSSIMLGSHEISISHHRVVVIATEAQYWNRQSINHQPCSGLMKFLLVIIVL